MANIPSIINFIIKEAQADIAGYDKSRNEFRGVPTKGGEHIRKSRLKRIKKLVG